MTRINAELEMLESEVRRDFKTGGPLVWRQATKRPAQADLVYVNGSIFNYKTARHGYIAVEDILVVTAEERNRRVSKIITNDPAADMSRLSDVLLYDKLFNPSLTKMQDEEYPVISERQYDRRQKTENSVGDNIDNNASDGKNHSKPTKRVRNVYENTTVDNAAKSRNAERRKKYADFTRVQPVVTFSIWD